MNLGLAGKRVIVTGAGRGIGKAICLCLAKEGAIIAAASRTAGDIEKLLGELGGEKRRTHGCGNRSGT